MSTLNASDDFSTDERRTHADPHNPAQRRLQDTPFNRARWPVFLGLWAVGGAAILAVLLYVA